MSGTDKEGSAPPPGAARSPSPAKAGEERRGRDWRKGRTFALDAGTLGAFVAALRRGATVEEAAREAEAAVSTLYWRRRTCPPFAEAWDEAKALGARPRLAIVTHGGGGARRWQLQRARTKRPVDRARKQAFLDRFALSCNLEMAAAEARIGVTSVYRHLRNDGAFARGFEETLKTAYAALETEAVRARLAEQAQAYHAAPDGPLAVQSFERTMRLLREYKRGFGRIGRRPVEARLTKWSFDDAFRSLEKRLAVFGLRIEAGEGPPDEDCD